MWTILIEILPAIVGIFMGAYGQFLKDRAADQAMQTELFIRALAAKESSIENARRMDTPHTSWARKFIAISVIGVLCWFPMLLSLLNWGGQMMYDMGTLPWLHGTYTPIEIYIPQEIVKGGLLTWFYKDETTEYIALSGFVLLPIHVLLAQLIGGFYFGQGGMKRVSR